MNEVQARLTDLEGRGWSLAAIADAMEVSYNAAQKWKAGARYPSNAKAVLLALDGLLQRNRTPKRRRGK